MKIQKINQKLIKIGKQAVEPLKKLKQVKSIFIEGSVSEGVADKYSDIDIRAICIRIPQLEKVKKTFSGITNKIKVYATHEGMLQIKFLYKEAKISIVFTKDYRFFKKEINKIFKNPKDPMDFLFKKHILYYILSTIIVSDPERLFEKIKRKIRFTENVKRAVIKKSYDDIRWNFLKEEPGITVAIKRKNFIGANNMASKSIETFIDIIYTLNNKLYYYPKWVFKIIPRLKKKPKRCAERLQKIAKLGNTKKDIEQKIKIFKSLMKDIKPLIKEYLK